MKFQRKPSKFVLTAAVAALFCASSASAALVDSLGNTAPGFNDGDTPTIIQLINAQSGQPNPFDGAKGSDVTPPSFTANWTHTYAVIVDPISSATLTIGIADHDSQATGDQVSLFSADGTDLTAAMNLLFEGSGGGDAEYNVYALALSAATFASLADGSAAFVLNLAGPGLQTAFPSGVVSETTNNGAHLIFSTLDIQTGEVPEPSFALPVGIALLATFEYRRRKRRRAV